MIYITYEHKKKYIHSTATSAAIDSAADDDSNHDQDDVEYASPPIENITGVDEDGQPVSPLHCARFAIAGGTAGIFSGLMNVNHKTLAPEI